MLVIEQNVYLQDKPGRHCLLILFKFVKLLHLKFLICNYLTSAVVVFMSYSCISCE